MFNADLDEKSREKTMAREGKKGRRPPGIMYNLYSSRIVKIRIVNQIRIVACCLCMHFRTRLGFFTPGYFNEDIADGDFFLIFLIRDICE